MHIIIIGLSINDVSYNSAINEKISYKTSLKDTVDKIPLPQYFTSLTEWPKTSNLLCWVHAEPFNDIPKFIPINWSYKDGGFKIKTRGCFCEWGCAKTFLHTVKDPHIDQNEIESISESLLILANQCFKEDITCINPVEPYYEKVEFSGKDY